MALTRKTAGWVAAESTYGTDPSSGGSGYKAIPALGPFPRAVDMKAPLATEYSTGYQYPTAPIAGRDGWMFEGAEVPLIGMATAAGDGLAASSVSDDWADILLQSIFGTQYTTTGEGVASTGNTNLTLDSPYGGPVAVQDLIPVFEAALPSSSAVRSQWALATVDNTGGSYTIAPQWTSNPTTAAVAYGSKIYRPNDAGGSTLAFCLLDDDLVYRCLGGRITSASIVGEIGQITRLRFSAMGDTKTEDASAKTALPVGLAAPVTTPIKTLLSPLWFNGTQYATRRFELNFNLAVAEVGSSAATNGRATIQSVTMRPTLTVEFLRTDAIQNFRRNATSGRVLLQLGSGVVSGGILNGMCAHFEEANAREISNIDADGVARHQVVFEATDRVAFSGTTISNVVRAQYFQLARA